MRKLLPFLILLAGCPPKPPVPPPTPTGGIPLCSVAANPKPVDVCPGIFTPQGLACVRCDAASSCVDRETMIYCVSGTCLSDRVCSYHLAPDSGQ